MEILFNLTIALKGVELFGWSCPLNPLKRIISFKRGNETIMDLYSLKGNFGPEKECMSRGHKSYPKACI